MCKPIHRRWGTCHALKIFSTHVKTIVSAAGLGELPIHIYIEGCINPPCRVIQGEDVVINVVFKAPYTIRSMRTKAVALSIIDYPLGENGRTCNFLSNTYCPILKDEIVQYTLRMHIERIFPTVAVDINFSVVDQDEKPIWCINTVVQVQSPTRQAIDIVLANTAISQFILTLKDAVRPPCPVISGEHVTINVVFKVPRTLRRMETKAYVPSYNIHFPLLGDSVTCNYLSNTYCPVLKDEVVQYTLRMFILPRLSAITLEIYFYVADENQQPIWCISVGIAVQSPTNNINIQNSTLIN
ncbi:unnamed protein product [Leptosia nina]|uniref:MD-2-related lipid-recognition domain-containing protein n=1 Tax=Leptosia nina TaxID=320188 RepID=A0AAV1J937_9NEOP